MTRAGTRKEHPERMPEGSREVSESASDTPGVRVEASCTPKGCKNRSLLPPMFWHPFRVRKFSARVPGVSSRVALLNPRLPSGSPSGCSQRRLRRESKRKGNRRG